MNGAAAPRDEYTDAPIADEDTKRCLSEMDRLLLGLIDREKRVGGTHTRTRQLREAREMAVEAATAASGANAGEGEGRRGVRALNQVVEVLNHRVRQLSLQRAPKHSHSAPRTPQSRSTTRDLRSTSRPASAHARRSVSRSNSRNRVQPGPVGPAAHASAHAFGTSLPGRRGMVQSMRTSTRAAHGAWGPREESNPLQVSQVSQHTPLPPPPPQQQQQQQQQTQQQQQQQQQPQQQHQPQQHVRTPPQDPLPSRAHSAQQQQPVRPSPQSPPGYYGSWMTPQGFLYPVSQHGVPPPTEQQATPAMRLRMDPDTTPRPNANSAGPSTPAAPPEHAPMDIAYDSPSVLTPKKKTRYFLWCEYHSRAERMADEDYAWRAILEDCRAQLPDVLAAEQAGKRDERARYREVLDECGRLTAAVQVAVLAEDEAQRRGDQRDDAMAFLLSAAGGAAELRAYAARESYAATHAASAALFAAEADSRLTLQHAAHAGCTDLRTACLGEGTALQCRVLHASTQYHEQALRSLVSSEGDARAALLHEAAGTAPSHVSALATALLATQAAQHREVEAGVLLGAGQRAALEAGEADARRQLEEDGFLNTSACLLLEGAARQRLELAARISADVQRERRRAETEFESRLHHERQHLGEASGLLLAEGGARGLLVQSELLQRTALTADLHTAHRDALHEAAHRDLSHTHATATCLLLEAEQRSTLQQEAFLTLLDTSAEMARRQHAAAVTQNVRDRLESEAAVAEARNAEQAALELAERTASHICPAEADSLRQQALARAALEESAVAGGWSLYSSAAFDAAHLALGLTEARLGESQRDAAEAREALLDEGLRVEALVSELSAGLLASATSALEAEEAAQRRCTSEDAVAGILALLHLRGMEEAMLCEASLSASRGASQDYAAAVEGRAALCDTEAVLRAGLAASHADEVLTLCSMEAAGRQRVVLSAVELSTSRQQEAGSSTAYGHARAALCDAETAVRAGISASCLEVLLDLRAGEAASRQDLLLLETSAAGEQRAESVVAAVEGRAALCDVEAALRAELAASWAEVLLELRAGEAAGRQGVLVAAAEAAASWQQRVARLEADSLAGAAAIQASAAEYFAQAKAEEVAARSTCDAATLPHDAADVADAAHHVVAEYEEEEEDGDDAEAAEAAAAAAEAAAAASRLAQQRTALLQVEEEAAAVRSATEAEAATAAAHLREGEVRDVALVREAAAQAAQAAADAAAAAEAAEAAKQAQLQMEADAEAARLQAAEQQREEEARLREQEQEHQRAVGELDERQAAAREAVCSEEDAARQTIRVALKDARCEAQIGATSEALVDDLLSDAVSTLLLTRASLHSKQAQREAAAPAHPHPGTPSGAAPLPSSTAEPPQQGENSSTDSYASETFDDGAQPHTAPSEEATEEYTEAWTEASELTSAAAAAAQLAEQQQREQEAAEKEQRLQAQRKAEAEERKAQEEAAEQARLRAAEDAAAAAAAKEAEEVLRQVQHKLSVCVGKQEYERREVEQEEVGGYLDLEEEHEALRRGVAHALQVASLSEEEAGCRADITTTSEDCSELLDAEHKKLRGDLLVEACTDALLDDLLDSTLGAVLNMHDGEGHSLSHSPSASSRDGLSPKGKVAKGKGGKKGKGVKKKEKAVVDNSVEAVNVFFDAAEAHLCEAGSTVEEALDLRVAVQAALGGGAKKKKGAKAAKPDKSSRAQNGFHDMLAGVVIGGWRDYLIQHVQPVTAAERQRLATHVRKWCSEWLRLATDANEFELAFLEYPLWDRSWKHNPHEQVILEGMVDELMDEMCLDTAQWLLCTA